MHQYEDSINSIAETNGKTTHSSQLSPKFTVPRTHLLGLMAKETVSFLCMGIFFGVITFAAGFLAISFGTYYGEIWVAHRLAAEHQMAEQEFLRFEENLIEKYKSEHSDSQPETKDFHGDAGQEF